MRKKHRKLIHWLGDPEVTPRLTPSWSAAGAARHYNLRLPTEGLRQGHGSPWQWPAPGLRATAHAADPPCEVARGFQRDSDRAGRGEQPQAAHHHHARNPWLRLGRNRAGTNAKREPLGNGSETAKRHLNPSSGTAKNGHAQAAEVAPLEPVQERREPQDVDKKRDATEPGQTQTGASGAMDPKRPNAT